MSDVDRALASLENELRRAEEVVRMGMADRYSREIQTMKEILGEGEGKRQLAENGERRGRYDRIFKTLLRLPEVGRGQGITRIFE